VLCESLAAQFASGKGLTVRQQETMRKRVEKYFDQIPNYDDIAPALDLPVLADLEKRVASTRAVVELARDITNFAPPAKGRRKFNEEEFITSLIQQFDEKAFLTDRQLSNLRRIVVQHSSEIADFEARSAGLELEEPVKVSDTDCPMCEDGKMSERRSRGRVFFGCTNYPKCKYTNRNLEDVPARGTVDAAE
jgi:hypothetical protein